MEKNEKYEVKVESLDVGYLAVSSNQARVATENIDLVVKHLIDSVSRRIKSLKRGGVLMIKLEMSDAK